MTDRRLTTVEAAGFVLGWFIVLAAIGYVGLQALWALAGVDGAL